MKKKTTMTMILALIGVAAALMVMVLPAIQGAREQARRASCLSNLMSMAFVCQLYAQDFHGAFPYSAGARDSNGHFYLLFPAYMTSVRPFICPSDADCRHPAKDFTLAEINRPNVVSYAYVAGLSDKSSSDSPLMGDNLADVSNANMLDTTQYQRRLGCSTKGSNHGASGGNIVFVDGSATWNDGEKLQRKTFAAHFKIQGEVTKPTTRWADAEGCTTNIKNPNGLADEK